MKLYLVRCRGLQFSSSGPVWGIQYVVANDPTEAYQAVKQFLVRNSIGFPAERELDTIQLLAEDVAYPECKTILQLPTEIH